MPNAIYINPDPANAITFKDSGGTVAMTLDALATGNTRQSAKHDLGAGPRCNRFICEAFFAPAGTLGAVGETVDVWIKFYNENGGTIGQNDTGTTDAEYSAADENDKLVNLVWVGSAIQDEDADNITFMMHKAIEINGRYFSMVVQNNTSGALDTTPTVANQIILTPCPYEVQ